MSPTNLEKNLINKVAGQKQVKEKEAKRLAGDGRETKGPGDQGQVLFVIRQASSTRPLIRVIQRDGVKVIHKDFSRNSFLYRNIVGRFLSWREARAYRRLEGLPGIPRLLAACKGPALMFEFIDGLDLKQAGKQGQLPPDFFDHLKTLVHAVHERGVAHCDLKASGNILVRPDGRPVIIDWGASIAGDEFNLPLLRMIYRRFLVDDERAVIKHKLRCFPEAVGPEEKACYDHRGWAERLIRAVRDKLREWLQAIA